MSEQRQWHGPSDKVRGLTYSIGQQATKIANLGPDEQHKIAYHIQRMRRLLDDLIDQAEGDRLAHLVAAGPRQDAPGDAEG